MSCPFPFWSWSLLSCTLQHGSFLEILSLVETPRIFLTIFLWQISMVFFVWSLVTKSDWHIEELTWCRLAISILPPPVFFLYPFKFDLSIWFWIFLFVVFPPLLYVAFSLLSSISHVQNILICCYECNYLILSAPSSYLMGVFLILFLFVYFIIALKNFISRLEFCYPIFFLSRFLPHIVTFS